MPGLRETQLRFAAAILRPQAEEYPVAGLVPADERLTRRLAVYRVNARENFTAALEAAFPLLRWELGDEQFCRMARSYQAAHPSRCGNLYEAGRQLPGFLAQAVTAMGIAYLRDVARLEWAVQEAMTAADGDGGIDLGVLAGLSPDAHGSLRFILHPSVRLLQTDHAVLGLWREFHAAQPAGRAASGAVPTVAEHILVRRAGEGIELHPLDALEHQCLACLQAGGSLEEMAETGLALGENPDIGAILARWVARGVITGLVIGGTTIA